MSDIMQEARDLYHRGVEGIPALHPATRFSIRLAATLYSRILDKIEANDFDVFARRAHLGAAEKWMAAAPVYLRHRQADAGR
jgi:phytoene synthase